MIMEPALIVSISSLVVSAATLFFTHLRPPKIEAQIGPPIRVYYADHSKGVSFGIYVPTTFINLSGRTGTVLSAGITIHRVDTAQQRFFMQWRQFSKLDDEGNWTHESNAHALVMSGKASQTKMIWFMWEAESQPKLFLREGEYELIFLFWDRPKSKPHSISHRFFVSEAIHERLEDFRSNKRSTTTEIVLDQQFSSNKFFTSHEAETLFNS